MHTQIVTATDWGVVEARVKRSTIASPRLCSEGRLGHESVHGFTMSTPTSAKSSTFLVATVAS